MKHFPTYILLIISALLSSCKSGDDGPPINPFDIPLPPPDMIAPPPDSSSIVGLHAYIFSKSCAVPGCHDGSFEPDFRTVQSSYSTLVFHPVVKNNAQNSYEVRVKPFDTDASWLFNRVTTDDQILGRMPLYDNPLTSGQIQSIKNWIGAGAPDMFGQVSALPNTQPQFEGVAAFLDFSGFEVRVDTIRDGDFAPFGVLRNRNLTMWFAVQDDSTALQDLANSTVYFSADPFDFANATTENMTYSSTAKVVPDFFGPGREGRFHWNLTVNTGSFPANALTYFRYSVEDGDHSEPLVFPTSAQGIGFQLYMSFYVAQ